MSLILLFQGGGPLPAPTPPFIGVYPGPGLLAIAHLAGDRAALRPLAGDAATVRSLAGGRASIRPLSADEAAALLPRGKVTLH